MSGQTFDNSGIDRSIGILVLGMIVVGFLIVMLIGMIGMDRTAKSVSDEQPRPAPVQVNDFSDFSSDPARPSPPVAEAN